MLGEASTSFLARVTRQAPRARSIEHAAVEWARGACAVGVSLGPAGEGANMGALT